jgi:hypothetical protein
MLRPVLENTRPLLSSCSVFVYKVIRNLWTKDDLVIDPVRLWPNQAVLGEINTKFLGLQVLLVPFHSDFFYFAL